MSLLVKCERCGTHRMAKECKDPKCPQVAEVETVWELHKLQREYEELLRKHERGYDKEIDG